MLLKLDKNPATSRYVCKSIPWACPREPSPCQHHCSYKLRSHFPQHFSATRILPYKARMVHYVLLRKMTTGLQAHCLFLPSPFKNLRIRYSKFSPIQGGPKIENMTSVTTHKKFTTENNICVVSVIV